MPWRSLAASGVALIALLAGWMAYDRLQERGDRQAGFVHAGPPPPSPVPRLRAYGFTARCAAPAPVYIFEAGTLPEAFIVILRRGAGDPVEATKTLAARYDLHTRGYDPDKRGFAAGLSSAVVAKLRCEPTVEALEEDPATRFSRDTTAP